MNILAIETATDVCSVAILCGDEIASEERTLQARKHSERLVPMIRDCLKAASLDASDIGAVSVSAGPGSYTGLRIGVSTAKGLIVALDVPFIAVPTLEALAWPALRTGQDTAIPVLSSRRKECYAGAFVAAGSGPPRRRFEDTILDSTTLEQFLMGQGLAGGTIVCAEHDDLKDLAHGFADFRVLEVPVSAEYVAYCARARFAQQLFDDARGFEPYYLRSFEPRKPGRSIYDRLPF